MRRKKKEPEAPREPCATCNGRGLDAAGWPPLDLPPAPECPAGHACGTCETARAKLVAEYEARTARMKVCDSCHGYGRTTTEAERKNIEFELKRLESARLAREAPRELPRRRLSWW